MRKKEITYFVYFLLIIFLHQCRTSSESIDSNKQEIYTNLDFISFFKISKDSIANSLAQVIKVNPIAFNKICTTDELTPKTGMQWIKEGYEYLTNNNAKITIWTDHSDQPYLVTYNLMRLGNSEDWLYEQYKADSLVINILNSVGIFFDGSEESTSGKYAMGPNAKWFNIELCQKFQDQPINYPKIFSEVEGDTVRINFLYLHKWYTNLGEVKKSISDNDLINIAYNYFSSSSEVISLPDTIEVFDLNIVDDKMCKRLGKAIIDDSGSFMTLYIDIQDGCIVYVERVYLRG